MATKLLSFYFRILGYSIEQAYGRDIKLTKKTESNRNFPVNSTNSAVTFLNTKQEMIKINQLDISFCVDGRDQLL